MEIIKVKYTPVMIKKIFTRAFDYSYENIKKEIRE